MDRIDHNDERLHTRVLESFLRSKAGPQLVQTLSKRVRFHIHDKMTALFSLPNDFTGMEVKRDWASEQGLVDLRVQHLRQKFVLLIENKTISEEGDRQLERYWQDAETEHPTYSIGGIFLTPNGRLPTSEGKFKGKYKALSYGDLADAIDEAAGPLAAKDHWKAIVTQYALAIRRWFVADPKMYELAWTIYKKYPEAVEFLSTDEAHPIQQILNFIGTLVKKENFVEVCERKNHDESIWFVPQQWDSISGLRHAQTASTEKRADDRLCVMWFTCKSKADEGEDYERDLILYLGAVAGAQSNKVKRLLDASRSWPVASKQAYLEYEPQSDWTHIWARRFLTETELNREDREKVFKDLTSHWKRFLKEDLTVISNSVLSLFPIKS